MESELDLTADKAAGVEALARRYLWWESPSAPHSVVRAVAQIMNFGTYEDVMKLEALVSRATLGRVMSVAEPGWFSARSWEFWRGRLDADIAERPPSRSLADVT